MRFKFKVVLLLAILVVGRISFLSGQCTGIDADAGPDLFACDPNDPITLQGNVMGNYTKFSWSPTSGLSDPMVLDPQVTHKNPGIYKYKLSAEGVGTTNLSLMEILKQVIQVSAPAIFMVFPEVLLGQTTMVWEITLKLITEVFRHVETIHQDPDNKWLWMGLLHQDQMFGVKL